MKEIKELHEDNDIIDQFFDEEFLGKILEKKDEEFLGKILEKKDEKFLARLMLKKMKKSKKFKEMIEKGLK